MIDVVLQKKDSLNQLTVKHTCLNTDSLQTLISVCSLIDYINEFKENAYLCILHSSVSEKELTNFYQTNAKRNLGKDNLDVTINFEKPKYEDYYMLNMTKGVYTELSPATLTLLCFKGNEYLSSPYKGFCEEYLGEWCGDAICIMKKSEAKSLIKTFEEEFVYFDLGGIIDG